jgi:hypothetical protein
MEKGQARVCKKRSATLSLVVAARIHVAAWAIKCDMSVPARGIDGGTEKTSAADFALRNVARS